MPHRIRQIELNRRRGVAVEFVVHAPDTCVGVLESLFGNRGGYGGMLVEELLRVPRECAEIAVNRLVTTMDSGVEPRVVDVYPVGVTLVCMRAHHGIV